MCSCIGACFASICCGFCGQCSAVKSGPISRLPYLFLFIAAGIFSIVMSLYGEESLNLVFYDVQLCPSEFSSTCMGTGSVYRTSFILFLFELLHIIIIGAGAVAFHWLWFSLKFIIFIICLTLTFIINSDTSNTFFQGYANYFARYISALYLILQILILIIWSYETNEIIIEKINEYNKNNGNNPDIDEDERGNECLKNPWSWLITLLTIGFYIFTFIILGIFYHWYAPNVSCAENIILITITIVLCVLNAIISFIRGDGSFFVASIVSLYATFLLFAGLQSVANEECNLLYSDNKGSLWIGYIISFLSIGYAALRADRIGLLTFDQHKENNNNDENINEYNQIEMNDIESDKETDEIGGGDKDTNNNNNENENNENENKNNENIPPKQQLRKTHTFFHIILTLAACYYAMLFTNWANSNNITTKGQTSLWVNIGSQWCCIGLFWWTVLAPLICPSRFKSNDDDDDDD